MLALQASAIGTAKRRIVQLCGPGAGRQPRCRAGGACLLHVRITTTKKVLPGLAAKMASCWNASRQLGAHHT